MSNENFIREIDEELRSDQMRAFWKNFGPWIIALAVLAVVGTAGWEAWQWWSNSNSARSSDQFYTALELTSGTDIAAAQKALAEVEATGTGSYPTLARFREAALLVKEGKTAEATAAYDAIATAETNTNIRGLALVLAAYTLVDGGDVAAVNQRVAGLAVAGNPMRNAAREANGLTKYKAGDLNGALADFEAVLADPGVSREATTRLQIFVAQLTALGAAAPATDAAAATDATPAPAADAPAAPAAETPAAPAAEVPADPSAMEAVPAMEAAPAMEATPAMEAAPTAETPVAPASTDAAPAATTPAAPAATTPAN
jgi:hypothetical protein